MKNEIDNLPPLYRIRQDNDGEWRVLIGGAGDQGEVIVGFSSYDEAVSAAWDDYDIGGEPATDPWEPGMPL